MEADRVDLCTHVKLWEGSYRKHGPLFIVSLRFSFD